MKFLFEDLNQPKQKPVLDAIKRLMEAGVSIEKIADLFGSDPEADKKILAIAQASFLLQEKAVSFMRLNLIYECAPAKFAINHKQLQEIYEKSADKYFLLTKNNWDFFTNFISGDKTSKDFEILYEKNPKKFNNLKVMWQ